ncbi:DUF3857 domain-containing transglutaminase family protein [Aestuariibaculum sediminum]|uniref:DUF3857 domain-containing transglutaminase family protein n=1 Tax=Aestuariibaculum sediminum TaxID=2770637 RepID=A0A8J6UHG6_9FLAO|nr:DUF3857 domain-containing transglutaminase family protein [Aestuariibaculum sediminum]MBD0832876.1 DUF3857 domain-containing transglutaminase family protein [Aestuariibaculum sediminum]
MNKFIYTNTFLFYLVLLCSSSGFSQEKVYTSKSIPDALTDGANAVVRNDETRIILEDVDEMLVSQKRIVTVLNKSGNKTLDAMVHYDDNVKIKHLEAVVYNKFGVIIKKIKEKTFLDVSAVPGGTLYSDSRVKYLNYSPSDYPYTIEFTVEYRTSNTAFIPSFLPVNHYHLSVERSSYTVSSPENIEIRKKEKRLSGIDLEKKEDVGVLSYIVKNIPAVKPEEFCPTFVELVPRVLIAAKQFSLEGVNAEVENWEGFGKWMYNDLLLDTADLSESTIAEVRALVENETTAIEKARKIYQYVQDKVRYISVQVGIGGWKPFHASKVDELSYGDCKGLTNYTMALLQAVGVNSNYCVVYADSPRRNIEKDFAIMQGNHAFLLIPSLENQDDIWLECTSQDVPFGFIGDFTDDRDVLVITPEGGKIKHTKKYETLENSQKTKGSYVINDDGSIHIEASIASRGIQYNNKYWYEKIERRDLDVKYKENWDYLNTITINKMEFDNNKNDVVFTEKIHLFVPNYTKKAGNIMLLPVNALNRNSYVPDKYKERKYPVIFKRGFIDEDEVEIKLPKDYLVEALPEPLIIENKFGSYHASCVVQSDNTVLYKRKFMMKDGKYPKEDYDSFREFFLEVSKYDNAKIALTKNQ